jgi:hypothetical protein
VIEAVADDELARDVGPAVDRADPVDRDDVGVLEPGDRARLDRESLERGRLGALGGDELDRDVTLEHRIAREVDAAHAADPEQADDHEAIELRWWLPTPVLRHDTGGHGTPASAGTSARAALDRARPAGAVEGRQRSKMSKRSDIALMNPASAY